MDQFSFNQLLIGNKYSETYQANYIQYHKPRKSEIKESSREENELREKLIGRYSETFVDKLGKNDRISVPPIRLEVDKRKEAQMLPREPHQTLRCPLPPQS